MNKTTHSQYRAAINFFGLHNPSAYKLITAFGTNAINNTTKINMIKAGETPAEYFLRMLSYIGDPDYETKDQRNLTGRKRQMRTKLFGGLND